MNELQTAMARLAQYQIGWQQMLEAAARERIPVCPNSPEDRVRADIRNEAVWLLQALQQYRAIPLEERY